MSDNKRYYWLKLKEDFFTDIRMKRLRKISAGGTYTIIYLKLLLLSLRDEGKLYFERVDETFVKEIALVIDETEDDIALTLQYLKKVGLLKVISEDEYFLTELPALIGSETDWASKKRNYREQRKMIADRTMSSSCLIDVRQVDYSQVNRHKFGNFFVKRSYLLRYSFSFSLGLMSPNEP